MKLHKRVWSMLMSVVLLCSIMVLPASAADTHMDVNTTIIQSVQVIVKDNDPNAQVTLYKIAEVMDTKAGGAHSDASEEMRAEASALRWAIDTDANEAAYASAIGTWAAAYANGKKFGPVGSEVTLTMDTPDDLNRMTNEQAAAFYQALSKAIVTNEIDAAKVGTNTLTGGITSGGKTTYTLNSILTTGAYVAVGQSGVNVYATTSANLLPYRDPDAGNALTYPKNTQIEMKYSKTSITKEIIDDKDAATQTTKKEATVAIGDTVTFQVETGIPKYQGDFDAAKVRYTIVDVMHRAYKYTENSMNVVGAMNAGSVNTPISSSNYALITNAVVYAKNDGVPIFVQNGTTFYGLNGEDMSTANSIDAALAAYNSAHGTTAAASVAADYSGIIVDFTGSYGAIKDYDKLAYEYKATITDKAVVSATTNTNTAHLNYSVSASNPNIINTMKDTVTSFTYALDVTKQDGNDANIKLNGVYFDLWKLIGSTMSDDEVAAIQGANGYVADDYEFTKNDNGTNTVYQRIQQNLETKNYTDLDAAAVAEGLIKVEGLDIGTYKLVEISTLAGYNLLSDPIMITLNQAASEGSHQNLTGRPDGRYEQIVQNFKGITLPSTGGAGTMAFLLFGILLMGGAMALLLLKYRRRTS